MPPSWSRSRMTRSAGSSKTASSDEADVGGFADVVARPLQVVLQRAAAVGVVLGHEDGRPVDVVSGGREQTKGLVSTHESSRKCVGLETSSGRSCATCLGRSGRHCARACWRPSGSTSTERHVASRRHVAIARSSIRAAFCNGSSRPSSARIGRCRDRPACSRVSVSARATGSIGLLDQNCAARGATAPAAGAARRGTSGLSDLRAVGQAEAVTDAAHGGDPARRVGSGSIFRRTRRTCSVTVERPCHSSVEPQTRSSRSSREKTWPGDAARKASRSNSLRVIGTTLSRTVTVRVSRSTTRSPWWRHVAAGSPLRGAARPGPGPRARRRRTA